MITGSWTFSTSPVSVRTSGFLEAVTSPGACARSEPASTIADKPVAHFQCVISYSGGTDDLFWSSVGRLPAGWPIDNRPQVDNLPHSRQPRLQHRVRMRRKPVSQLAAIRRRRPFHRLDSGLPEIVLRLNIGPVHFRYRHRTRELDRKSTRLNSSHLVISYAVFCLKKQK